MTEILSNLNNWIEVTINALGPYGVIFSCLLIIIESIIPILPLSLFIAILYIKYGAIIGFIISWICTIIGCTMSFFLFQTVFQKKVDEKLRKNEKFNKILNVIDNISFRQIVVLLAIPFTPAFLVNIAAGISKINYKKYLLALIIGKIFLVYFWGEIGLTLMESLKNPMALIKIVIMVIIAYVISIVVNKKLKID